MNDNNKLQSSFLFIISIVTLIVAIIGTSFTWFNLYNNKEKSKGEINNKNILTSVVFEQGSNFDLINSNVKFKVSQIDKDSKDIVKYNIKLDVVNNTLTSEELSLINYSLNSSGNTNGGSAVSVSNENVYSNDIVIGSGQLVGYEEHEYEFILNKPEQVFLGEYTGSIIVELINENKSE